MTVAAGHALVVGGTGMLRGASLGLVERGFAVSVVARSARRLAKLKDDAEAHGGVVRPVCVDWRYADAFAFGLEDAVRDLGPLSLAVVWSHSDAPDAPFAVARLIEESPARALLPRARERDRRPVEEGRPPDRGVSEFRGLEYREIVLGFVVGADRSRWLTETEIAAGVLGAIDSDARRTVVGAVEPWDARP